MDIIFHKWVEISEYDLYIWSLDLAYALSTDNDLVFCIFVKENTLSYNIQSVLFSLLKHISRLLLILYLSSILCLLDESMAEGAILRASFCSCQAL